MASAGIAPWIKDFDFERSRVGALLRYQTFPTLGEIAFSVNGVRKWGPHGMDKERRSHWRHEEYYPFLWELLDKLFGGRPDYRLW
jgi:hypothetical protein